MNCWKTIRISREYGTLRLMMYSGCTMLFTFLFYYLVVSSLLPTTQSPNVSFPFFMMSILALFFVHKLLHLLPIWICGKKALLKTNWFSAIPVFSVRISKPLARNLYLTALLTPVLTITAIGAFASAMFPMYIAYISILSSIHFGFAFYDILYASYVIKAPKHSFVENHEEGFHILIKQAV
ncbi:DUF3267 domain-containing protein [Alkalihalobacillus sp. MEB130]|uniref:DUF3267 domain-containing protein n=1 Tax=Alkalihalobacillus sp. MEB130 TaxID=2976704 RepID=UPI0028DFC77D|nr:DUF3267 domain-containing protein [Alkalihalobacillus sp. MEB130]MDT8862022.1 DUF3267 domain-containing protein [Alkalihalobacillus sp. MEB130]